MNIAFIGSVGVPNCYGGFESFLDAIAPHISKLCNEVIVTCDESKYLKQEKFYNGITRIFIPIPANGVLSPLHDIFAFFRVIYRVDCIYVLGVSAGPFFLLMRFFAFIAKVRLVINIDGVEWRRSKYSRFAKCVLWLFDFFAQFSANSIIYDNKGLKNFVHPIFRKKSYFIPYPADKVYRLLTFQPISKTALTICRIEPENNIEMLIQGALSSELDCYTLIGNWENSLYGKNLQEKYRNFSKLKLLDPVYDPIALAEYREKAFLYLHGHSVGGTNPSLIEMLPYRCQIIAYDCIFNRETLQNQFYYFLSSTDLSKNINTIISNSQLVSRVLDPIYMTENIANKYMNIGHQ